MRHREMAATTRGWTTLFMSTPTQLSAECRLVFRSADPSCAPAELAALAVEVRDWKRVVIIAERQMATLTIWRALRESAAALPTEVSERLRRSSMVSDLRMQQLARRTEAASRALAERGVPFMLLKGAAIGALTDPTFRSRPMSDVDVLVHRTDVPRASEALIASGWPMTTDPVLLELLKDAHHLPHFVDPHLPGVRIELHVALMPEDNSFAFGEADLWRDATRAPAPFDGALVPSPMHLMLHACVHFAWQHTMHFGAWRTFRVVGALTRDPSFDWESFVGAALAAKAGTCCYWTLRLADRLCGIAPPAGVLDRLAPPTPKRVRLALERHFVAGIALGEAAASPSEQLTRLLWRTALRPKWSGHRAPGRHDPEQRWTRARGLLSNETRTERLARHLAAYRDWWHFFSRTLLR